MEPAVLLNNFVSCSRATTGNRARLAHIWNVLEKQRDQWSEEMEKESESHRRNVKALLTHRHLFSKEVEQWRWIMGCERSLVTGRPLLWNLWTKVNDVKSRAWAERWTCLGQGRMFVWGVKYCWFMVVTKTSQNKPDDLHLKTMTFFYGYKSCDLFLVSLEMWCNQIHLLKYFLIFESFLSFNTQESPNLDSNMFLHRWSKSFPM